MRSRCFLWWPTVLMLLVGFAPAISSAAEPLPRSVLIVTQWDTGLPWTVAVSSAFRATLRAGSVEPVAVHMEFFDLSRFYSPAHQENFHRYLREKYRDQDIGAIVAVGPLALELMLGVRLELGSPPIVFNSVDESTVAQMNLPAGVTGRTAQLTLRDMVRMARMLVPNLKRFVIVGEPLEGTSVYRNFKQELPLFTSDLEFIDLTGLPMTEVKKRVAALPDNTAILYTAIFRDGAGFAFSPTEALSAVAEVANRPIVISTETQLGHGGVGGFILQPGLVGEDAARLALRILAGESAANIPVALGDYIKPLFDWRQLTRWGISESQLPPGSEVRFQEFSLWEQYRWLIVATLIFILAQAALVAWLYFEHRNRRVAELQLRRRLLEVIHLNRTATAGALSASVAHELNQPLGAIRSNAEAAEIFLKADPPNLEKVGEILTEIRQDDQRAADIISHLRTLLKKRSALELQNFDLNEVVRNTLHILGPEALKRGIVLSANQTQCPLPVRADQVHLQQVILNLAMNGMDAMEDCALGTSKMTIQTALGPDSTIDVLIADSGVGVPADKLNEVFDTFYTTKQQGTGLGLSIARTIIETYGGKIWAENRLGGGAAFRFNLPLAGALAT